MGYAAKFRNRESFLYKLFRIGLIPGSGTILILTAVFLPMMYSIAQGHDAYYEEILLYAVSSQFERINDEAEQMRQKIESSGWLHELFVERCLYGEPVSVANREQMMSELNLWIAQGEYIVSASFRFRQRENELYSNMGVYLDLEYFQDLRPDAVQYRFFSGKEGFSSVELGGRTYLIYCSPVSDVSGGAVKGEINLIFDAAAVSRKLDLLTEGKCSSFRLAAPDGTLLWSCAIRGGQEDAVLLQKASLSGAYQYEAGISRSLYRQSSRRVLPVFLAVDGICILLCSAVSLLLAFLGFRPIDTIVHKLPHGNGAARDELETLSQAVDHILQERLETTAALDGLRLLARQNLLAGLLSGTSFFTASTGGGAENDGLMFHYPLFCAVACHLPFSQYDLAQPAETVMEVLTEHSRGDLPLNAYLYYEDSDHYRILVNFSAQQDLDLYLERLAEDCRQYLHNETDVPCFGVGETVRERRDLYRSNEQSGRALHFAAGGGPMVYFKEIASQVLGGYYYPFSIELLLSRAILDGSADTAKSILLDVIKTNEEQHRASSFSPLYADLFSTVLRSAQSLGITLDNRFFTAGKPAKLPEIQNCVEQAIDCVCGQLLSRSAAADEDNVNEQILDYIEKNLFRQDLSLGGIAGTFHKTASYVSLLFKRMKGVNYSDYVNQARINKAVELLVNGQKNAKEVCEEVGYISYFTFRRNFIKYTNMSPSEFRTGGRTEQEGKD